MKSDDRQSQDSRDGMRDAAEEERMIRIMQYCDGVLAAPQAAEVADEIARDPEAARLAAELTAGADAVRTAWGGLASDPVPLDLARRVAQSARLPAQNRRRSVADWRIAAAVVVGAALGVLGLLAAQHGDDRGLRLAGSDAAVSPAQVAIAAWQPALMTVLAKEPETARANFRAASGVEGEIGVVRWFDTMAGLRCAEFAQSTAGAVTGGGVACKRTDGGWDVIGQQR